MDQHRFLAIDFGTTQTAVAAWTEKGGPEVVSFNGSRTTIPSAVFCTDDGTIITGVEADQAIASDPARGLRTPKLRLRHGSASEDLGADHEFGLVHLISFVMREALMAGREGLGGLEPDKVCLTCPVAWREGGPKWSALTGAAAIGGIHAGMKVVSEPAAAARHMGADMVVGARCVVFDLGGGTCDVAVMERTDAGLALIAEGETELGGETFDHDLLLAVLDRLHDKDAAAADRLVALHDDPLPLAGLAGEELRTRAEWLACVQALGRNVRAAKERLSSRAQAAVLVPAPVHREFTVTRSEFEALIGTHLERAKEIVEGCVEQAGGNVRYVFLAGAASQTPAVARAVEEALGIKPVLAVQPKEAIALGAVAFLGDPIEQAKRDALAQRNAEERERQKAERRKREQELEAERRKREQEEQAAKRREQEIAKQVARNRATLEKHALWPKMNAKVKARFLNELSGDETVFRLVMCSGPPQSNTTPKTALLVTSNRIMWAIAKLMSGLQFGQVRFDEVVSVKQGIMFQRKTFSVEVPHGAYKFESLPDKRDAAAIVAHIQSPKGSA